MHWLLPMDFSMQGLFQKTMFHMITLICIDIKYVMKTGIHEKNSSDRD